MYEVFYLKIYLFFNLKNSNLSNFAGGTELFLEKIIPFWSFIITQKIFLQILKLKNIYIEIIPKMYTNLLNFIDAGFSLVTSFPQSWWLTESNLPCAAVVPFPRYYWKVWGWVSFQVVQLVERGCATPMAQVQIPICSLFYSVGYMPLKQLK